MNNIKNNQAFTLIEVLASITILGIVLTVFLSFFSNATLFSAKTEDKLTAINLAEKELYEVTRILETYCETKNEIDNEIIGKCQKPTDIPGDKYNRPLIEDLNNKNYHSTVTPFLPQNSEEISLGLLPISVRIDSEDNKELTTVYGYVKLDPEN